MGKIGKSRRGIYKRLEKAKRKAANGAMYEKMRLEGNNAKREKEAFGRRLVRLERHRSAACGNVGCKRCFPALNFGRRLPSFGVKSLMPRSGRRIAA